jgi:hypothetical protein
MGYLEQAVRSRWAVPMTAFLIQLSQYWNTLVTVTWWSKRATVSVVWFCVLWLATILLLEIFLNDGAAVLSTRYYPAAGKVAVQLCGAGSTLYSLSI